MNLDIILNHLSVAYEKEDCEYFKVKYHIVGYIKSDIAISNKIYMANCYVTMRHNMIETIKFTHSEYDTCAMYIEQNIREITLESFNKYLNICTKIEINKSTV